MVWVVSLSTTKLIPRRLTPLIRLPVFGVCFALVRWFKRPRRFSALPPATITKG